MKLSAISKAQDLRSNIIKKTADKNAKIKCLNVKLSVILEKVLQHMSVLSKSVTALLYTKRFSICNPSDSQVCDKILLNTSEEEITLTNNSLNNDSHNSEEEITLEILRRKQNYSIQVSI